MDKKEGSNGFAISKQAWSVLSATALTIFVITGLVLIKGGDRQTSLEQTAQVESAQDPNSSTASIQVIEADQSSATVYSNGASSIQGATGSSFQSVAESNIQSTGGGNLLPNGQTPGLYEPSTNSVNQ